MADITFEEIVQAARKLSPQQKTALVHSLQISVDEAVPITRAQALADLETLRAAGAFTNVESLRNKFARPDADPSDEELNAYLQQIGTEWERELDDLTGKD